MGSYNPNMKEDRERRVEEMRRKRDNEHAEALIEKFKEMRIWDDVHHIVLNTVEQGNDSGRSKVSKMRKAADKSELTK